jgi:hypothetical protein
MPGAGPSVLENRGAVFDNLLVKTVERSAYTGTYMGSSPDVKPVFTMHLTASSL